jgi:hypothetical protein
MDIGATIPCLAASEEKYIYLRLKGKVIAA